MRWLQLLLLLVLLPLAACGLNSRTAPSALLQSGPYSIDAGDVLRVAVYGDEGISKTYKVDESGQIAFPLAGPIRVGGLTTSQAAGAIAAALANGFMRRPDVAVEVDTYRPFYIQGDVKAAGQYAFVPGMTVRAAISTAGGFADLADSQRAVIYRQRGGAVLKDSVGLDFPIYPGDTIVIGRGTGGL